MSGVYLDNVVDLTFLAIAVLGVLLTGIAKSGFGGGIGVVAVPMMAPFIGGEQAIGILLPILLLMDIMTLRVYRRHLSFALVKPVLPGILIGITAGSLLLGVVSERGVQALIGLMGFWVLAQKRWPWMAGRRPVVAGEVQPQGASALQGGLLGGLAGIGSALAHAGAAPLQAYFLLGKLNKESFLAQITLAIGLMNAIKLLPYGMLGLLNFDIGWLTLLLVPVAFVGIYLGRWLSKRIDGDVFFKVMMWLLAGNSTWLLGQAVIG